MSKTGKVKVVVKQEVDLDEVEDFDNGDPDFKIEPEDDEFESESETEDEGDNEDLDWQPESKVRKKCDRRNEISKSKLGEYARLKEEDPEKYAAILEKHRDYDKNRRVRSKEKGRKREMRRKMKEEDPEAYEAYKRRHAEATRKRRERLKNEDPEKYEAIKRKKAEVRRNWLQSMKVKNPLKYEEYKKRQAEIKRASNAKARRKRRVNGIDEQERIYSREKKKQWLARKTDEELEELRRKRRFYTLIRKMNMSEEERARSAKQQREFLDNLSGEKLERHKQNVTKAMKKMYEKRRNDPVRLRAFNDKIKEYQRKKVANETPEERQKRLRKYKINAARRKLRKELEEIGVPPEEIERRSKLMKEEMEKEPLPPVKSEYRPRLQARKPRQVRNQRSTTRSSSRSSSNVTPDPGESSTQDDDAHFDRRRPRRGRVPRASNSKDPKISKDDIPRDSERDLQSQSQTQDEPDFDFDGQDFSPMSSSPPPPESVYNNVTEFENVDSKQLKLLDLESLLLDAKPHICEECKGSFLSEDDVRTHFKLIHTQKCWKCPKCSELCINPTEFSEHYQSHSIPTKTVPPVTNVKIESAPGPSTSSKTPKSKSSFPLTTKSKSRKDQPPKLSKVKKLNFNFLCFKCEEKFVTLNELSDHVRKSHPQSFWPCSGCKLLKYCKSSLSNHQKFCSAILRNKSCVSTRRKNKIKLI